MFYQHSNGSTSLPRGFRFHYDEPRTPEPATQPEELEQPSPPRPAPRLKVRRRNGSGFQAPTQQFLASVAVADIPIPTIEEPHTTEEDLEMPDREPFSIQTSGFLAASSNFSAGSLPKTPMPESASDENTSAHPDWSAVTPDYYSRPMSSLSNNSDFSDDSSFYGGSRISRPSDDGSCTSPESDIADPFQFPASSKVKRNASRDKVSHVALNSKLRSKNKKNAPWSKAQSQHLWNTYMIYLSDPTVTPFRIGASSVPPQGIVRRVAREAKRSWKGPKSYSSVPPAPTVRRSARLNISTSRANSYDKSGSITPTLGDVPKAYTSWPHSSNTSRAHLRDLCKTKDSNPVQRHHHFQSRSPTPFTKPYTFRTSETSRLSTAPFNTFDISFSLATSTAESMQPDGPLAQLANSDGSLDTPIMSDFKPMSFGAPLEDGNRGRRLGSPFMARTYGPSSSKILNFHRPSPPRTQSDTIRLGSPVRFDESRSLNVTMKRRAQNPLDEELAPRGNVLRPSILNEQIFGAPKESRRRVRSRGFSLGDEAFRHRMPGLFQRSPPVPALPTAIESPIMESKLATIQAPPQLLPSVTFDPPRLGSPFSESANKTFPRRLFQDGTATVRRSQPATMHKTRASIESFDFGAEITSVPSARLQSRLQHLDDKLKQIHEERSLRME